MKLWVIVCSIEFILPNINIARKIYLAVKKLAIEQQIKAKQNLAKGCCANTAKFLTTAIWWHVWITIFEILLQIYKWMLNLVLWDLYPIRKIYIIVRLLYCYVKVYVNMRARMTCAECACTATEVQLGTTNSGAKVQMALTLTFKYTSHIYS